MNFSTSFSRTSLDTWCLANLRREQVSTLPWRWYCWSTRRHWASEAPTPDGSHGCKVPRVQAPQAGFPLLAQARNLRSLFRANSNLVRRDRQTTGISAGTPQIRFARSKACEKPAWECVQLEGMPVPTIYENNGHPPVATFASQVNGGVLPHHGEWNRTWQTYHLLVHGEPLKTDACALHWCCASEHPLQRRVQGSIRNSQQSRNDRSSRQLPWSFRTANIPTRSLGWKMDYERGTFYHGNVLTMETGSAMVRQVTEQFEAQGTCTCRITCLESCPRSKCEGWLWMIPRESSTTSGCLWLARRHLLLKCSHMLAIVSVWRTPLRCIHRRR